ncbi:MAG TPA: monovalent cation/H+ antiporter complex subunit F [Tardiphaga sp.]
MAEFVIGAAVFIALTMALGLVRLLRGPTMADRMMAAQLLGTSGAAICLLISYASELPALLDVALTLALLAALAAATMSLKADAAQAEKP